MIRSRRRFWIGLTWLAATALIGWAMLGNVAFVGASHVEPVLIDDAAGATCGGLIGEGATEVKFEDDEGSFESDGSDDGTYTDSDTGFSVDLTFYEDAAGNNFVDFENANFLVDAVFVKGGSDGNLYLYDPPETADDGLHAPVNPSGKFAAVSHISFCFSGPFETPTPPPTPGETPTPTPEVTPTPGETPTPTPEVTPTPTPTGGGGGVGDGDGTPPPTTTEGPFSNGGSSGTMLALVLLAAAGIGLIASSVRLPKIR